jgi:hypothetical protein
MCPLRGSFILTLTVYYEWFIRIVSIKESVPQRMEAFIEHMHTSAGARDLARFEYLATDLVNFIGVLPIHEKWVQDVLYCLSVHTSGPPGAEQLRRDRGLLRAAADKRWDKFCHFMWLYTIPTIDMDDVFQTIRRVRVSEGLDDDGLIRLDILEQACRDFNRELGWRCANNAARLIADARQAAAKTGATTSLLIDAQNVILDVLLGFFERDVAFQAELQRMGKITYQYKKCVMALRSPEDGIPDVREGGVDWFIELWRVLQDKTRDQFRRAMAAKLNGRRMRVVDGVTTCDFCVTVGQYNLHMKGRKGPQRGVPVVFCLKSGLEELAAKTFNAIVYDNGEQKSAFEQAMDQLTQPHQEYDDFRAKAYDLPEARGDHFMQSRLVPTRAGGLHQLLSELQGHLPGETAKGREGIGPSVRNGHEVCLSWTWRTLDARVRTAQEAACRAYVAHFAHFRPAVRAQLMARNARLNKVFDDHNAALNTHSGSETVDSEYAATVLAEFTAYRTFWNETCESEGMQQALLATF